MSNILVLNAGSSSLKCAVHRLQNGVVVTAPLLRGLFELSPNGSTLTLASADAPSEKIPLPDVSSHKEAIEVLMSTLRDWNLDPDAVGHRVVHGGGVFTDPKLVDDDVYAALEGFIPLAPLHQPHNLAPINALRQQGIPQVACFDTGFHGTIAPLNHEYALPAPWTEKGFRKFGFHGLSYEYIASILRSVIASEYADGKVVVAHLGSGSSMCGMKQGKSVLTSLEFSTIGRLTMGTRPGAIDAVMALMMAKEIGIDELVGLLHKKCGLLGLSGLSADVRDLESAALQGNERALFALDFYAEQVAQEFGKLFAGLRGVDVLVFTAGIGERGSAMRARICEKLECFGVRIDTGANQRSETEITAPTSKIRVLVLPTNEELMIANHTADILF